MHTECIPFFCQSQRTQLLKQLNEVSRLKSEADASNATLRSQVTTLEQELQSTRYNYETTKAELTAVILKLQNKEAELDDKIKEYYQMEVRNGLISVLISELLHNIFSPNHCRMPSYSFKPKLES